MIEEGTCIEGHQSYLVCIPDALKAAWDAWEQQFGNDSDFTLGELFRNALVDYLRPLGALPKPWV